jgi:hypothetical protein
MSVQILRIVADPWLSSHGYRVLSFWEPKPVPLLFGEFFSFIPGVATPPLEFPNLCKYQNLRSYIVNSLVAIGNSISFFLPHVVFRVKCIFQPPSSKPIRLSTPELQNWISGTVQLSKPDKFSPLIGFKGVLLFLKIINI